MAEVIDWDEAMEQCGDDEEFLRELLADLRDETDQQVSKIEDTIRCPNNAPFHRIMRASHVVKGAASNLMCEQLRVAAWKLEQAAKQANAMQEAGSLDPIMGQQMLENVKALYMDLKQASDNYNEFCMSEDV